jgi:hypothetical protein
MIDKKLLALLRTCAQNLDALGAEWAMTGATAMSAYGYERATKDIDLFVADDVRVEFLQRLRTAGFPVEDVMPPAHYSVEPRNNRDREKRIDLLFPAMGVESLGLMAARRMRIEGLDIPVMPLPHLVAIKLQTDPAFDPDRYAKDQQDLRELRSRGLIDIDRVQTVLDDVRDPSAVRRLQDLMTAADRYQDRAPGQPQPPSTRGRRR